ncbi:InlB B-repeat-containing protein [bacterium]|nr:InlB B-repeat-containing protein [bacterium]
MELTAEWNPVPYTVTFYKNDGTNEKTVEHFVYDKQRAIQTSYERDGYFFKGWNTESDGN